MTTAARSHVEASTFSRISRFLLAAWAERHRRGLAEAGGPEVDFDAWRAGLALGVRHFILTRLPMYALIHRFRPQRFLPAVVRDAMRLHATTRRWLPAS